jgi:XTP/dITP diphosphohydrolase
MMHLNELVIVSSNLHKVKEISTVLKKNNLQLISLPQTKISLPESIESFRTYKENAKAKGDYVFDLMNKPVLSDDSGLEVETLKGEPGIYSQRYSKEGTDFENRKKLINKISKFPEGSRKAKFVCVIYFRNMKTSIFFTGEVNGILLLNEKGENGFGYDPIFYYPELHKTFAELTFNEKLGISHRGIALQKLKKYLFEKENTEGGS